MLAGIPPSTLQTAIERQAKDFSVENMKKLAAVLDVNWWVLTDNHEDMGNGLVLHYPKFDDDEIRIKELADRLWNEHESIRRQLLAAFEELNTIGQTEAVKRVREMAEITRYRKGGEGENGTGKSE